MALWCRQCAQTLCCPVVNNLGEDASQAQRLSLSLSAMNIEVLEDHLQNEATKVFHAMSSHVDRL
eukprot:4768555-Amphidinium_carterae.1